MQNKIERPLSPHLTIYKPQITSVLSILHRITGAFSFILLILFHWWITYCLLIGTFEGNYITYILQSKFGLLIAISFSLAIIYHTFAGIRHLLWDMGYGLELQSAYRSGKIIVVLSILFTFIMWAYILYI